ncbi:MAG TPA: hypothetical protein VHR16_02205 [Candidatus Limnocylindrales bacterium]|nr:hypothetical protein [Candidatus Limnocylindrales bacterium]
MSRRLAAALAALALLAALPAVASANHSWGGYHWARTANPFTLKVGDNVNSTWDPYLSSAVSEWSQSTVLNLTEVAGNGSTRKKCNATSGQVEVCNNTYGNNGWLGVAQIWASGTHITQGTVRLNDTYFNTPSYNTSAWRNLVMCQEVGHTFGLDHQDENFNNTNLGTCMDYTSNPGSNQTPNAGDYDELLCIYDPSSAGRTLSTSTHSCTGTGHLDSSSTIAASLAKSPALFGLRVATSNNGRTTTFYWKAGANLTLITHVIWA